MKISRNPRKMFCIGNKRDPQKVSTSNGLDNKVICILNQSIYSVQIFHMFGGGGGTGAKVGGGGTIPTPPCMGGMPGLN